MWIAVRLSLAPVQTFFERGFPFSAYWGFARGQYWRVFAAVADHWVVYADCGYGGGDAYILWSAD